MQTCIKSSTEVISQHTCVPALYEASSEVQGALQQTKPGVDSKSISYLLCSDRQHPFGTYMKR